jgi:hypothetical protein
VLGGGRVVLGEHADAAGHVLARRREQLPGAARLPGQELAADALAAAVGTHAAPAERAHLGHVARRQLDLRPGHERAVVRRIGGEAEQGVGRHVAPRALEDLLDLLDRLDVRLGVGAGDVVAQREPGGGVLAGGGAPGQAARRGDGQGRGRRGTVGDRRDGGHVGGHVGGHGWS